MRFAAETTMKTTANSQRRLEKRACVWMEAVRVGIRYICRTKQEEDGKIVATGVWIKVVL